MTPLLFSLLTLAAAPLLDRALRGRPVVEGFVDGLVQVMVAGLILVHVLPAGLMTAGWPALAALVVGVLAGLGAHRFPGGERSAGVMAVVALALHAFLDGTALAAPDDHLLAEAVILHTLPVGLAIWRVARGRGGTGLAVALLTLSALMTAAGFVFAASVYAVTPPSVIGVLQCGTAGALLHVLSHIEGRQRSTGVGALFGLVGVALLTAHDPLMALADGVTGVVLSVAVALLVFSLLAVTLRRRKQN